MEGEPRPKVRAKLPLGEERRGKVDKQGTRKNKDEKSPRLSSVVDLDAKDDYVVAMASDVRALKNLENQKYSSRQEKIETLSVGIESFSTREIGRRRSGKKQSEKRNWCTVDTAQRLLILKNLTHS